jgi:hypothetical protein
VLREFFPNDRVFAWGVCGVWFIFIHQIYQRC